MGRSDGRKGEVGVRVRRGGTKGGGRNGKNNRNRGMGEVGAGRGTWWRYGARVRYMGGDRGKKVDQGYGPWSRQRGRRSMQTWSRSERTKRGAVQA